MPKVSAITLAQKTIASFLRSSGKSVFSPPELIGLIEENRQEWSLPFTTSADRIIKKLVDNQFFQLHEFEFSTGSKHTLYLFQEPSIFEIAVSLKSKSYISHYPAVFLHELTTQVPKTIYTTQEQAPKEFRNSSLEQEAIDKAFAGVQRRSNLTTAYGEYTIVLLSGMHSSRQGVLLATRYKNTFSFTGLERTLIDITVRPNYGGGAYAVLEAYKRAIERNLISWSKFINTLDGIEFIYPYHQAIGFYLERAGYSGRLTRELENRPREFDFYLDYGMNEKEYDGRWRIWYPTGLL